jgi:hypothetical protein
MKVVRLRFGQTGIWWGSQLERNEQRRIAMSNVLTLKLPEGASAESGKNLEAEFKQIEGVKSAGVQQTRGLDAAAIAVWLSIANPAMDVIKKIIDVIRGKGLSGVEIQQPNNGGTIKVDSASPADLEKLLKAVRGA